MIRSFRNAVAPINKIPPEILTLIPDFWRRKDDSHLIALTHVCRTWREIFTSRSSLWTRFGCENADKIRVYLERSKSSPIHLRVFRGQPLLPNDPFLEIDPPAISRLKSIEVHGWLDPVQEIIPRLSHPAPLLESLTIKADRSPRLGRIPVVTNTLFDGDLSSLRELCLHRVHTELPWRNLVNLTSFTLAFLPPGSSTTQLLDFFESAPRLRQVELIYVSPAPIDQNERIVSLTCLKEILICDRQPTSPFIGHLLIPAGASLHTEIESHSWIEDHLPRSLRNLRNLSNFTQLRLRFRVDDPGFDIKFVGPNGKIRITSIFSVVDPAGVVLEFLDWFDTSTVDTLEVTSCDYMPQDLTYRLLLPMRFLRALTISPCDTMCPFARALNPDLDLENVLVCPKLEKLVLHTTGEKGPDIKSMEAARASRGAKLGLVQIVDEVSDGED